MNDKPCDGDCGPGKNTMPQQFVLNIPFPVFRISCHKCKSNFAILAFAGNAWLHQKPAPGSPVYCPYCKETIFE